MTPIELFLQVCYAGFSLILLLVSLSAYRRYGQRRLAVVSAAFLLFLLSSGLVLASGILFWDGFEMSTPLVAINLAILLFLYLSIVKR
ncbi:MAG: hypothetical protein ACLFS6_09940 [Methanomassiliicoccales archaeon]